MQPINGIFQLIQGWGSHFITNKKMLLFAI